MLPGGRLEDNETWLGGLQIEVREETGIVNISIDDVLNVDTSDSGKTYIATFLCKTDGTPEIKLSNEHQSYAWLKAADIEKYEFWHEKIKKRLATFIKKRQ